MKEKHRVLLCMASHPFLAICFPLFVVSTVVSVISALGEKTFDSLWLLGIIAYIVCWFLLDKIQSGIQCTQYADEILVKRFPDGSMEEGSCFWKWGGTIYKFCIPENAYNEMYRRHEDYMVWTHVSYAHKEKGLRVSIPVCIRIQTNRETGRLVDPVEFCNTVSATDGVTSFDKFVKNTFENAINQEKMRTLFEMYFKGEKCLVDLWLGISKNISFPEKFMSEVTKAKVILSIPQESQFSFGPTQ